MSKPHKRMHQAATQVNVLSPVMSKITEADAFHNVGRQYPRNRYRQECVDSVGILGSGMVQDGRCVNLGDPLLALWLAGAEYRQTSQSRQGCWDGVVGVGSARSTPSAGKPRAWGRGRRGEAGGMVLGIHASQRAK